MNQVTKATKRTIRQFGNKGLMLRPQPDADAGAQNLVPDMSRLYSDSFTLPTANMAPPCGPILGHQAMDVVGPRPSVLRICNAEARAIVTPDMDGLALTQSTVGVDIAAAVVKSSTKTNAC
jgi:hypothetical protein